MELLDFILSLLKTVEGHSLSSSISFAGLL